MNITETAQKATERRSENRGKKTSRDIFVIIFCIVGIAASLFLFQLDLFKNFRSSLMHPAGIVTVKYNTVMRLFNDMMVWDRLYKESPVYNEDLVYMARLSGATLHLGDDRADGIELGEYTMIRIHNSSRVELISGSANISVRSNKRFQLLVGDSVVEASRGTVLNASSDDGFSLRVREGNARILRDGQVQEVQAGSVIFMNAQGDGTYSSQTVASAGVLPALNSRMPVGEGFVVIGDDSEDHYFTWTHSTEAEYYLFQISANRDLSAPVISERLRDNYYIYRRGDSALTPGRYYWSVSYVDAAGNTSIPSDLVTFIATTDRHAAQHPVEENALTFTEVTEPVQTAPVEETPLEVIPPAPQPQAVLRLTLLSPANNAAIPGLTALRQPTTFRWDTDEEISSSRFVLSRRNNPAVGRAEVEINNPTRTLTVPRIGEGVWYWTVEGRTRDGRTVTASAPRQLRVQAIPLLPAPSNRLPASGFQIGADEFRQRVPIVFSWSRVAGANSYILTILKDGFPRKIQIFQTDPIQELSYTLENYRIFDDSGSYSWRVEAVFYNTNSGVIEQRGNPAENNFALNVPSPSRVRPRSTGVLYGTQ